MGLPRPKATINKSLGNVVAIIEEFRKLHTNMSPSTMLSFIAIATEPGITVSEVAKRTSSGSSSAVRSIALLSSTHRSGMDGLDLIRYDDDIKDRRVKHLYLKPTGERVWSTMKRILEIKD